MKLLALCGSQRTASMSGGLLRACRRLAPDSIEVLLFEEHKQFPLFNPELAELPPGVHALHAAVDAADAILIASPEYAHGVTGTIKNTLDWLVGHPGFAGKPVAVLNPSWQSHHADESIKETLRMMSAELIDDACVRIPVIGAGVAPDAIAASERFAPAIEAVLRAVAQHLARPR
ncbi:NADPH-dependent FMN reductase [Massilia sp. 2TAF26]|uniref:NADPH-dependent FMN reductase n=1 Tax=Massilia sp. 2TAF26 TaxID=3233012 RepID=UPI003F947A2F